MTRWAFRASTFRRGSFLLGRFGDSTLCGWESWLNESPPRRLGVESVSNPVMKALGLRKVYVPQWPPLPAALVKPVQPTMVGDPFFGFRLGSELAEEARSVIWPHHFDAPMIPPPDRC
jgi:hypothetical protein